MCYKSKIRHRYRNLIVLICWTFTIGQSLYNDPCAAAEEINKTDWISFAPSSPLQTSFPAHVPDKQPSNCKKSTFIGGVAIYPSKFNTEEINRLAKNGVVIGGHSRENYIELISGNILLNAEKDMVIGAAVATIQLGHGSAVFIVKNPDNLTIYDLHQTKPKQVVITVSMERLSMEPGQVLTITEHRTADSEKLGFNYHQVIHKNNRVTLCRDATNLFLAEFSIVSALTTIAPLKSLLISSNIEDKKLLEKLVRDAVIFGDNIADIANDLQLAIK